MYPSHDDPGNLNGNITLEVLERKVTAGQNHNHIQLCQRDSRGGNYELINIQKFFGGGGGCGERNLKIINAHMEWHQILCNRFKSKTYTISY